jgi:hypothetical protein
VANHNRPFARWHRSYEGLRCAVADPGGRLSYSAPLYWLLELAEVEGRRVGKLLLCQVGCKLCLTADFDLIDRTATSFSPIPRKPPTERITAVTVA